MVTTRFGRYYLLEHVASGGMADVYRAEARGPHGFAKEVALKLIRSDFDHQPKLIEMFLREAWLASKLTHANIVQVFDFGQVEDKRYYTTMEYVHGRSLSQTEVRRRSLAVPIPFGIARAVHLCAQVALALDYAHRRTENGQPLGLVHRDVSPHNILISFEGEVKLADFGIARAINTTDLTRPGDIKGKPAYMSPEQAQGLDIDFRADVFSLGIVLWKLCTERRLFKRESDLVSLLAVVGPDPVIEPPSQWNKDIPPELDQVVLGALERYPAKRTASASEFAHQLQPVLFKLAKGPLDFDLRSFMSQLWPDGASTRSPPLGTSIETLNIEPGNWHESTPRAGSKGKHELADAAGNDSENNLPMPDGSREMQSSREASLASKTKLGKTHSNDSKACSSWVRLSSLEKSCNSRVLFFSRLCERSKEGESDKRMSVASRSFS